MEYVCPICNRELVEVKGNQINVNDGVTLYCPYRDCPCQEVMGHGNNVKNAYEVVKQRFTPKDKD